MNTQTAFDDVIDLEIKQTTRDRMIAMKFKPELINLFKKLSPTGTVGFNYELKHELGSKIGAIDRILTMYTDAAIRQELDALDQGFSAPTEKPDNNNAAAELARLIGLIGGGGGVDLKQVQAIVDKAVRDALVGSVKTIELTIADMPKVEIGVQHFKFETLLRMCSAKTAGGERLSIWLVGPPGTGKTTAARMVAKAFNMDFNFNGALSAPHELVGFLDAMSKVSQTAFRKIWEHGGVYLFDEIDGSHPKALLALNAALANSICSFPDALITRHPDCIVIAGANTYGKGATADFTRDRQDAASLDRFVPLDWPIDEALEYSLAVNKSWCKRVQSVRKNLVARSIKNHMITPRATFYGEALLAAGMAQAEVEASVLRKSLAEDAWNQISA